MPLLRGLGRGPSGKIAGKGLRIGKVHFTLSDELAETCGSWSSLSLERRMAVLSLPVRPRGFGESSRRDRWWLTPLLVFSGLMVFVAYATWAAFQGRHYHVPGTNYLSPFYSPLLFEPEGIDSGHSWFGSPPAWWPSIIPFSAALLILPIPAGFRLTCYYYRGAYYKAFWADPPACAVGEPRTGYVGESSWPLILQNAHRYFLYLALLFILILTTDALAAFRFPDGLGVGVGTIILVVNVGLLAGYTFGCHSLRHLVGGRKDCLTNSATCLTVYRACSRLNRHHPLWAWLSLFSVMFADMYIRLCSCGIWKDYRLL